MTQSTTPTALEVASKESGPVGKLLFGALGKSAEISAPTVRAYVRLMRRRFPEASPAEIQKKINDHFRAVAIASGAGVGATAMVPGIGTMTALGATAAESFLFLDVAATFALASAAVRDIDIEEVEQRHTVVLMALAGSSGAVLLNDALMGASGTKLAAGGPKLLATALAQPGLGEINNRFAQMVIKRMTRRAAAAGLGKLAPAGIGAALGGWANNKLAGQVIEALETNMGPTPDAFPVTLRIVDADEDADGADEKRAARFFATAEAARERMGDFADDAKSGLSFAGGAARESLTAAGDFARDSVLAAGGLAGRAVRSVGALRRRKKDDEDGVIDGEVIDVQDIDTSAAGDAPGTSSTT